MTYKEDTNFNLFDLKATYIYIYRKSDYCLDTEKLHNKSR